MSKEKYSIAKLEEKRRHLLSIEKVPAQSGKTVDHVHFGLGLDFFEEFHKSKSLSPTEKEQIVADFVNSFSSEKMQENNWSFAVASALAMPMILNPTGQKKGEKINAEVLDKLAEDLSRLNEVARTFVLAVIENATPEYRGQLESRINPAKGEMLNTIKPYYEHATTLQGRQHENAVHPTQQYKKNYQGLQGDSLKTQILADLKIRIDAATSPKELQDLKETPEYQTLEKRQGPNWLNYIPFLKTDSVKAFDSMVEEAEKRIENQANISSR